MPWLYYEACDETEVPTGAKLRVEVEGYPVAIYNVEGTLYASGDYCPHERVSLSSGGTLEGEEITCGAHRWAFNVRTGVCLEDPNFPLKRFPVGRKDGTVYVGFWSEEAE
jgi:nitrite reductase/ring-hydroxylating ferredoxin subunit